MAILSVIDPANKVPGIYLQVALGVGPRASGSAARTVALLGNKLSSGSMNIEQEYPVTSPEDVEAYAGSGSELHTMYLAAIAANPTARLSIIAIAESAGANASRSVLFTGTATKAGTAYVRCLGEILQVPVASGDTAAVLAARVNTYVNNKSYWPVTTGVATATVTATAKQKGPRGNFVRFSIDIDGGIGITVPAVAADFLSGGATSDSPQNVLDVLAAVRRTYFAVPYSDSTNLGLVKTHLDAQDEPTIAHRKTAIFGSVDTIGNTTTLSTAMNFARMQCAWLRNADVPPGMLAAALASVRAGAESLKISANHNGRDVPGIPPQAFSSWVASSGEQVTALDNGITPLVPSSATTLAILRSVTCKSQDSGGRPDYRTLDTTKVVVSDEIADRGELYFYDFRDWNADVEPPEGVSPAPNTLVPSLVKQGWVGILRDMETDGHVSRGSVDANLDGIQVELSTTSSGRFNTIVPFDVIEGFNQLSGQLRQVG